LKEKEKYLESIEAELDGLNSRTKLMQEHFKSVQSELANAQLFLGAKNKEISTEAHLAQLAQREQAKIREDGEKTRKEIEELQARVSRELK
jgi:chaperonin cofactor prefoldin